MIEKQIEPTIEKGKIQLYVNSGQGQSFENDDAISCMTTKMRERNKGKFGKENDEARRDLQLSKIPCWQSPIGIANRRIRGSHSVTVDRWLCETDTQMASPYSAAFNLFPTLLSHPSSSPLIHCHSAVRHGTLHEFFHSIGPT